MHAMAKVGIETALISQGSEVLLSTSLFDEIDREHLKGLLKGTNVQILEPRDIMHRATNNNNSKVNRDELAIVLTKEDYENKEIWNGSNKEYWIKSSVLILDDKLIGANYLYLEGVVGLAAAIMRQDRQSIRKFYQILTGLPLADKVLDYLKDNAVTFAINAILKFKPITIKDINKIGEHKRFVEDLLTAA